MTIVFAQQLERVRLVLDCVARGEPVRRLLPYSTHATLARVTRDCEDLELLARSGRTFKVTPKGAAALPELTALLDTLGVPRLDTPEEPAA